MFLFKFLSLRLDFIENTFTANIELGSIRAQQIRENDTLSYKVDLGLTFAFTKFV